MSHIILDVKNLSVQYNHPKYQKQIVHDVSFSVKAGKCLGILGESGSGKSMTTKAILGTLNRLAIKFMKLLMLMDYILNKNIKIEH